MRRFIKIPKGDGNNHYVDIEAIVAVARLDVKRTVIILDKTEYHVGTSLSPDEVYELIKQGKKATTSSYVSDEFSIKRLTYNPQEEIRQLKAQLAEAKNKPTLSKLFRSLLP